MKRLSALLPALSLLLALLAGCSPETPEGTPLWFIGQDPGGTTSLRQEYRTELSSVPEIMSALLAGPEAESGLASPIPEGTTLLSWDLSGSILHVKLSRNYSALTGLELTLANYCIALTLTELDGVDGVRITTDISRSYPILRREDVVFSGAEEEPVELTAALCFRQSGGSELGVELRVFRLTESESATMAVLNALIAGPQEAGLERLLPETLEVYSARVDAGVCYADFSSVLLEQIPAAEEDQALVIRSIEESLCSWGYVQAVQIMVEGEPLEWYGMVPVSQPQS